MPRIAEFEKLKGNQRLLERPGGHWTKLTSFFSPTADDPGGPQAFLAEISPNRNIGTHFHEVDQYQVVCTGSGRLGGHALAPGAVHFAQAFTPYGPIVVDPDGLAFLTLRPARDTGPGAQYLPERRARLDAVADRDPWQATDMVVTSDAPQHDPVVLPLNKIDNKKSGLVSWSVSLPANAETGVASPADCRGQYVVITKGSLIDGGGEIGPLALVWLASGENYVLRSGGDGLEALVVSFPARGEETAAATASAPKHKCNLCGYVYDERLGAPEQDIPPGTAWEDLPDTFYCPDCAAIKDDFTAD